MKRSLKYILKKCHFKNIKSFCVHFFLSNTIFVPWNVGFNIVFKIQWLQMGQKAVVLLARCTLLAYCTTTMYINVVACPAPSRKNMAIKCLSQLLSFLLLTSSNIFLGGLTLMRFLWLIQTSSHLLAARQQPPSRSAAIHFTTETNCFRL